jgi:transposase-like protein
MAFWLVVNCKNGISSCEMARDLKVTQKTAWFMDHRIREAIQQGTFEKIGGEGETVEVDETYIGGLAKNMHADKRAKKYRGGGSGKTAIFGLLARHTEKGKSKVRAHVVPDQWKETVNAIIKTTVEPGTSIYTDEHGSYKHLADNGFQHAFVRHAEYYVDGAVHTNGIENFWSLFKRGIKGTYISIEPFHAFRYIDEQAFRFNTREGNDADRFLSALTGVIGKRLTYKALTGKEENASPETNA